MDTVITKRTHIETKKKNSHANATQESKHGLLLPPLLRLLLPYAC